MKKLIILFGILFSANAVFAQAFKPVKIDSLVTVSLPATHTQKDTLGQQVFSANTDIGYILTIREPNAKDNQPLKKEKDLNSVLKKFVSGIQSQSEGSSAQSVRDTTVGTLKAKAFTLISNDGSGNSQYRNFLLIYTKEATYTFEYGYTDVRKDLIKDEMKAYFSSIKLSPELQRNDQYIDMSPSKSVNTNTIFEVGGGLLVIGFIIWLIVRKRNNEFA